MRTQLLAPVGLFIFGFASVAWPAGQPDKAGIAIQNELSQPFCYFSNPTDQIGFKGSPKGTIVTYDGAFLSAYGQLSFYAGTPGRVRPITQRVKTFLDGYIPVIQFHFDRDGLQYEFEAFATPIGLNPRNNLITFIQCKVSNPGKVAKQGVLGANFGDIDSAINVDPSYEWFRGQRKGLKDSFVAQRSTEWNSTPYMDKARFEASKGQLSYDEGNCFQGGHLVFTGPSKGAFPGLPSFRSAFKEAAVEYRFQLRPGENATYRFKMPSVPTEKSRTAAVSEIVTANYDQYRAKTISFWRAEVAKADRFHVDDPKVTNTFRTSLVNDLVACEMNEDGQLYQRVNKIHYNYMWIRDSAFFIRTYDMLGLHDLSHALLHDYLEWKDRKPVGFFKPGSRAPKGARMSVQDDYWGQVLWAVGTHCRTAGDRKLLEQVYPYLSAHIHEFVEKCKKDPRGLWPVAGPYDNEAINGHYTGHSFWALLGLRYAVAMAKEMNRPDDAQAWQKVHDEYEANFIKQLRALTANSEGYIPPGMDNVKDGNDWDNASGGIYPFNVLSKDDPMARATLRMVREYNYQEGIVTYGGNAWVAKQLKRQGKKAEDGTLHHYETFYITESNAVLGEQRKVVEDLYSILAHTGSTNSGFEFCIPAWSTRDPRDNFTPHGWFASRYMSLIRDVLVREEGSDIHLMSALAPKWVQPGKAVRVDQAPTFFGDISYFLNCRANGATLTLSHHWKKGAKPGSVFIHLPWFLQVNGVKVDGKAARIRSNAVQIAPDAKRVELNWKWKERPDLSYERAVRLFLEKFYRKPAGANYDFLFPVKA